VILFFHASWCPTCITINKDIEGNLKNIPKNITILKVNYDEAKDLREIYSVAGQYTFVQVDNSGKLIKKWRGGKTLQDALSQVEKTTESEIITTPENAPEPIVDKETTDPS
jgi:thiol-disulfide isomerase/thioredoxin